MWLWQWAEAIGTNVFTFMSFLFTSLQNQTDLLILNIFLFEDVVMVDQTQMDYIFEAKWLVVTCNLI